MADLRIPASAAEVGAEWLSDALRIGGLETDATVTSVAATPIGDAVGLMGEITRFDLDWDTDGQLPRSIVLKVPSVLEENRALGMVLGVYEGEHRVYSELVDLLGMRTPHCWFSMADAETGRYALGIEDLTGLTRVDQFDGVDLATAQACVDALADHQARWWETHELARLSWLPDGYGETLRVYRDIVAAALPAYEQSLGDLLTTDDTALCHRFVDEYDKLIDSSLGVPLTLLHRDFRVDNILFDDGAPVVLDWGNVARGSGLYDLTYFLCGSLTIDDRRAWGESLLTRYRERLAGHGHVYDDFGLRHLESALFCLIVPIMLGGDTLDTRDEKGARLSAEMTRRLFAYLHDHDVASALA